MFEKRASEWAKNVETMTADILPSPPDPRDYSEPVISTAKLPKQVALPVYKILNQWQTPYCAGASGAGAAGGFFQDAFSMTYLYWLAKKYDGIPERSGTYLRTICKVMQKYGCALEADMPFTTEPWPQVTGAEKAARHKLNKYYRLYTLHDIKTALAFGHYVLLATFITAGNWGRSDGWIGEPAGELRGAHGTFLYSYDDLLTNQYKGYSKGVNSWGERWGRNGKYYLPYEYFNMTLPDGRNKFIEAWGLEFKRRRENPWLTYKDLHRAKRRLWG